MCEKVPKSISKPDPAWNSTLLFQSGHLHLKADWCSQKRWKLKTPEPTHLRNPSGPLLHSPGCIDRSWALSINGHRFKGANPPTKAEGVRLECGAKHKPLGFHVNLGKIEWCWMAVHEPIVSFWTYTSLHKDADRGWLPKRYRWQCKFPKKWLEKCQEYSSGGVEGRKHKERKKERTVVSSFNAVNSLFLFSAPLAWVQPTAILILGTCSWLTTISPQQ